MSINAGRLKISQYAPRDGDKIILSESHRNGSDEVVGEVEIDGDEIEDALYVLSRAKAVRDRWLR